MKFILIEENPKLDLLLKRIAGIAAAVVAVGTLFVWTSDFFDPMHATEAEVLEIDAASMEEHYKELDETPYAMTYEIYHVANMMVDEQINDAMNEIEQIEDMEDEGIATPADTRKKHRLLNDIETYTKNYLCETGREFQHTHKWQKYDC